MTSDLVLRRTVLLGGVSATLAMSSGSAHAAPAAGGAKLVVIVLRGAMDGLAALPKLDDLNIRAHREALIDPEARALDGGFALHSAFANLEAMYRAGEAGFFPAIAGPYRERSHFAAQDLLESGQVRTVSEDGWLNRALQAAPAKYAAISIGSTHPLILRGASSATSSWSPSVQPEASDDTIQRLMDLYEGDKLLQPALAAGVKADDVAGDMGSDRRRRQGPAQYDELLTAAGKFLGAEGGPEIAVVGLEGWDTHAAQNNALTPRFRSLDQGLSSLRSGLGSAWSRTVVVAVTEFGRTVRMNGGRGTDHGTGGLAILAGGALKGGRMWGDWPGLAPSQLFEGRDLAPTTDARSLFKGLLRDHLGWDAALLDRTVFPDSAAARAVTGLV